MEMLAITYFFLAVSLHPMLAIAEEFCDVCGCFNNEEPFRYHPKHKTWGQELFGKWQPLPESWQTQQLSFSLFTPTNPENAVNISWTNIPDVYDPSRPTVYISHGWISTPDYQPLVDIKDAYFDAGLDVNVIAIDWSVGADQILNYPQSASNTRVIGACTAHLADVLSGSNVGSHHCIGHSLGSHICGFMGKALIDKKQLLGRITGLDPAGPLFITGDKRKRLDKSDAAFVDNIHTDSLLRGIGLPIGDVDFFPNKGVYQPACKDEDEDNISPCNHAICLEYYASSIRNEGNCTFQAQPCCSLCVLNREQCRACVPGVDCQVMGYYANTMPGTGIFYLKTTEQAPYCES